MRLKSLRDAKLTGKKVFFRVDYNVPLNSQNNITTVADDTRIKVTLPTIQYLIQKKAKVIIVTHLGRPPGKKVNNLSIDPVLKRVSKLIGKKVYKTDEVVGSKVKTIVDSLKNGEVAMLENTRFHPGEIKNDSGLAKQLASLADIIVNDGFAIDHRDHASVSGVAKYLPMYAGFHLMLEVKMLTKLMTKPKRPFVAVIGGAKVSDKVAAIHNLAKVADAVLVGGGVANNFLKAGGVNVLSSYLQDTVADEKKRGVDFVKVAEELMKTFRSEKMLLHDYIPIPKIVAPVDVVAAKSINDVKTKKVIDLVNTKRNASINHKLMFLDIGPTTIKLFKDIISHAKTIFWNGPTGVFEKPAFATGTKEIAKSIAKSKSLSILGGGDTIAAIKKFKLANKYDYVSSAGGAALDFLAGKKLPGLEPMRIK